MADDGPQQRPPFSDPHDPRWYSDPASRGAEAPGARDGAGHQDPGAGRQDLGARQYQPPQAPPYGGYGLPEPRGLSIAALVCGSLAVFSGGLLLLPQILAVVFGHLALRREPAGRPLALTGLIMGYVMLLVVVLLIVGFGALILLGTAASVYPGS
jgi:hypothetical protein